MKIINKEVIKALNPCKNRFDNYVSNYGDKDYSLQQFLNLPHITYDDKVWVCVRLMSRQQLVNWSILCAESVKHLFESKYPDNKSVSELLSYLKTLDVNNLTDEERAKLKELRNAAAAAAYYAAANAAAYAADAAYAAYAAYAYYAANYAAKEEQQNLNLLFLTTAIEKES